MKKIAFEATVYLDEEADEEFEVTVELTDKEYAVLKRYCRDSGEETLEEGYTIDDLIERVQDEAMKEYTKLKAADEEEPEEDDEEDGDSEDEELYFSFGIPEDVLGESWDILLEEYDDYPYIMEIVNDTIIQLDADLQGDILRRLLAKLEVTEAELAEYLSADDDTSHADKYDVLKKYGREALVEILGYDEDNHVFVQKEITYSDLPNGDAANDLLHDLGYTLEEDIYHGPHGHGTDGYIYIESWK